MPRRRKRWTLSPDTDRAFREACEAATREILQTRQHAHADIQRESEAWVQKRYGRSARALAFAARLHAVALGTLEAMHAFTLGPRLVALQALKRHSARVRPSKEEVRELELHLQKVNLPRRRHDQVVAAAQRAARDPYTAAVDRILSMQGGPGTDRDA